MGPLPEIIELEPSTELRLQIEKYLHPEETYKIREIYGKIHIKVKDESHEGQDLLSNYFGSRDPSPNWMTHYAENNLLCLIDNFRYSNNPPEIWELYDKMVDEFTNNIWKAIRNTAKRFRKKYPNFPKGLESSVFDSLGQDDEYYGIEEEIKEGLYK